MADLKAPTLGKPVYNGTHGNMSMAYNTITLKSQASGTKLVMLDIPIGTRITGVRLVNAALGASVTLTVKLRVADGTETVLAASASGTSAKAAETLFSPIMIADNGPAKLIVEIGGAAATGKIDAGIEYIAEGY